MNSQKQPPKEIRQNGCCECFSIIFEKYLFHFVSKVSDRIFLRINFFIDTTQPTFQRWINVVSILWIAVEITLIRLWKWNKIRSRIFNIAQHWYNVGVQHWNNVNQYCTTSMQSFFNVAQRLVNVVSTLIWHILNVDLTWPQRQLKLYQNQSG